MKNADVDESLFEELLKEAMQDVAALRPGTTLLDGRFVIGSFIGHGGMGAVYEATDNGEANRVALKVLSVVNPSGIYHLKQEFRALSDVVHPNLVVLHELFYDKGQWFFTMDYVVGKSLLDHLNVEPNLERLRCVFRELAVGIRVIHDAGKLHRDLKPNNVLVTPNGQVRILDFGLISDQKVGGVGQTIVDEGRSGTPTYMAPEQAAARPCVPATDWYAFGVMLFEALTGRPPFEDTPQRVLTRKQSEDAPRAVSASSGIPAELDQLCSDLLRRDPAERPGYEAISRALGGAQATSKSPIQEGEAPFIGRDKELDMLRSAFRETDNGRPVVVLVNGRSGIGKSTLIDHFLRMVELTDNAVILKGRCYERESVPFKACDSLIDELTRYLRRLPEQHAARLMPRHILVLAKIFPVLSRLDVVRQTKQRQRLPSNPNELRQMAFLAAKELLARIASRDRLILYVDDMQWSDVDGIKLLTSMVSATDPPSLMLICAYRSEDTDASPGLAMLHDRLEEMGDTDIRRIDLEQLSEDESNRLASTLLSTEDQGLASQIAKEAQGSPFFIGELARFAAESPIAEEQTCLERAIENRVSGLTDGSRELLELIAVAGRPIEESILKTAVNKGNISGPLRTLETTRLIRQIGGVANRVACYHDRIREAVASGLGRDRIRRCHKSLASAIEIEKSQDPIALTEHFLGAEEFERAGQYAAKAAKQAAETLAFDNAARLYRIALSRNPGNREEARQLQIALGDALADTGRGAEAAKAYMEAAEGALPEDALALRCRAAQQWINTGHMEEGTEELNRVLLAVGLKLHTKTSSSLHALFVNRTLLKLALRNLGKPAKSSVTRRKLLAIRACEAAMVGLWAADTFQSASFCARYLRLSIHADMAPDIIKGLASEAAFRTMEGERSHVLCARYMQQAEALSRQVNDPDTLAYLKLGHGMVSFGRGNLLEAAEYLEKTEQHSLEECTRRSSTLEMCQAFLGITYARLGRWGVLQHRWDQWVAAAAERGNLHHLATCRMWSMGCIRWLAADQPVTAHAQLKTAIREWHWARISLQQIQAMLSAVYIHLYNGEAEQAFDLCVERMNCLSRVEMISIKVLHTFHAVDQAYCALALAAQKKNNANLLRVACQQIIPLKKHRRTYGVPFIAYIHACIACIEGNETQGVDLLGESMRAFDAAELHLHAAAVRRRLAKLIGGDEGQAMFEAAEQTMRAELIVNPDRVTNLLAPGFPD